MVAIFARSRLLSSSWIYLVMALIASLNDFALFSSVFCINFTIKQSFLYNRSKSLNISESKKSRYIDLTKTSSSLQIVFSCYLSEYLSTIFTTK